MRQNKKYQFSNRKIYHSIPTGCMLALLLLNLYMLNPTISHISNAVLALENEDSHPNAEINDEASSKETIDDSSNNDVGSNDNKTDNTTTANNESNNIDNGISTTAETYDDGNTTASLIVDNDHYSIPSIDVDTGTTMYSSHTVHVAANNIEDYILQISGPSTLSDTNGVTTIHGAAGKIGSNMDNDTWGYGWGETLSSNDTLTYNTFSEAGTNLDTPDITNDSIDFTKKLVLAAKFSDEAAAGTYSTRAINLSLAISPKALIFDGITTMQQMTSTICAKANENDTVQLEDARDHKKYWVAKLKDGNCWMTQNLDLDLNNTTLTSVTSDVISDWPSTTGPSELWSANGGNYNVIKYYDPGNKFCNQDNCNLTSSANDGHDAQGNFYSYTAATAGTGKNLADADAPGSICPAQWQLPHINLSSKSLIFLANMLENPTTELVEAPYYLTFAGELYQGKLTSGTYAEYWSAKAKDGNHAFFFNLQYGKVPSNYYNVRSFGFAVRCVAR